MAATSAADAQYRYQIRLPLRGRNQLDPIELADLDRAADTDGEEAVCRIAA